MVLLRDGQCKEGEFKFHALIEESEGVIGAIIRANGEEL